jgi:hypothetical protein
MPRQGFETTISVFKREKAVRALNRSAAVTGEHPFSKLKFIDIFIFESRALLSLPLSVSSYTLTFSVITPKARLMKAFPVVIYFTSKSEEEYVTKQTAEDEKLNNLGGI